jgi:hypothetical protein
MRSLGKTKKKKKKDVIVGLFALGSSFLCLHDFYCFMKGNLHLSLNRPDLAVTDFRGAQELKADLRSYQGYCVGISDCFIQNILFCL